MVTDARCVLDARATLGEGAAWCERTRRLFWVDILAPALHAFDPATARDQSWAMPEPIGTVALADEGRVVVALASGLAWFHPETERLEPFLPIEADIAASRLNDGRCDRQGRLWVGSMARGQAAHGGTVYCCTSRQALPVLRDIRVPNCTAFSPDGRTMYFADTPTGVIRAFDLDPSSGAISNERRFATLPENTGFPDGATIDAEGGLWVAHWGGGRVSRFAPDGIFDRSISVPAPRVTCCAFGGPQLETLFITTARVGMDDAALAAAPLSGGLFAAEPGVRGIPEGRFRSD